MADRKVNWGILSTARINRRIVPEVLASERAEMLGVASRNLERARTYCDERGIPRAYGSYQQLLDDPDIDVVYIPLPNDMHEEWTIKALRAGKQVLCEKPFCMTIGELDNMESVARETGNIVTEAFHVPASSPNKTREGIA